MKKFIICLLSVTLCFSSVLLFGCGNDGEKESVTKGLWEDAFITAAINSDYSFNGEVLSAEEKTKLTVKGNSVQYGFYIEEAKSEEQNVDFIGAVPVKVRPYGCYPSLLRIFGLNPSFAYEGEYKGFYLFLTGENEFIKIYNFGEERVFDSPDYDPLENVCFDWFNLAALSTLYDSAVKLSDSEYVIKNVELNSEWYPMVIEKITVKFSGGKLENLRFENGRFLVDDCFYCSLNFEIKDFGKTKFTLPENVNYTVKASDGEKVIKTKVTLYKAVNADNCAVTFTPSESFGGETRTYKFNGGFSSGVISGENETTVSYHSGLNIGNGRYTMASYAKTDDGEWGKYPFSPSDVFNGNGFETVEYGNKWNLSLLSKTIGARVLPHFADSFTFNEQTGVYKAENISSYSYYKKIIEDYRYEIEKKKIVLDSVEVFTENGSVKKTVITTGYGTFTVTDYDETTIEVPEELKLDFALYGIMMYMDEDSANFSAEKTVDGVESTVKFDGMLVYQSTVVNGKTEERYVISLMSSGANFVYEKGDDGAWTEKPEQWFPIISDFAEGFGDVFGCDWTKNETTGKYECETNIYKAEVMLNENGGIDEIILNRSDGNGTYRFYDFSATAVSFPKELLEYIAE